ncbi:MAG: hypothetical protein J07HX5_00400 [halophilic archaeon J07HX5]|nr:MAG: hypothetical protein J07HX5_00400 [halophilic archaeon J07HX5]
MKTKGVFAPESSTAAQRRYADLETAVEATIKAAGREQAATGAEYDTLITDAALATAHDALFAALLEVQVGARTAFENWRAWTAHEVTVVGAEGVDNIAWHAPAFADQAVALTFQDERAAAVGTLRRQAFGRLYRPLLETGAEA